MLKITILPKLLKYTYSLKKKRQNMEKYARKMFVFKFAICFKTNLYKTVIINVCVVLCSTHIVAFEYPPGLKNLKFDLDIHKKNLKLPLQKNVSDKKTSHLKFSRSPRSLNFFLLNNEGRAQNLIFSFFILFELIIKYCCFFCS